MQLHESDCGESFRNRTDPEACIERDWDPSRRVCHPESLRVNAPAALHDCDRQAGKRMLVTGCDQGILELFEVHPLHRLSGVPRDTKGATGKTLDFTAHSEFSIGTCKKARIAPLRIKMSTGLAGSGTNAPILGEGRVMVASACPTIEINVAKLTIYEAID